MPQGSAEWPRPACNNDAYQGIRVPCVAAYCSTSNIPTMAGIVILTAVTMNKADRDRIQELCALIAVEQNRQRFLKLVEELNRILGAKEERLQNNQPDDSASK